MPKQPKKGQAKPIVNPHKKFGKAFTCFNDDSASNISFSVSVRGISLQANGAQIVEAISKLAKIHSIFIKPLARMKSTYHRQAYINFSESCTSILELDRTSPPWNHGICLSVQTQETQVARKGFEQCRAKCKAAKKRKDNPKEGRKQHKQLEKEECCAASFQAPLIKCEDDHHRQKRQSSLPQKQCKDMCTKQESQSFINPVLGPQLCTSELSASKEDCSLSAPQAAIPSEKIISKQDFMNYITTNKLLRSQLDSSKMSENDIQTLFFDMMQNVFGDSEYAPSDVVEQCLSMFQPVYSYSAPSSSKVPTSTLSQADSSKTIPPDYIERTSGGCIEIHDEPEPEGQPLLLMFDTNAIIDLGQTQENFFESLEHSQSSKIKVLLPYVVWREELEKLSKNKCKNLSPTRSHALRQVTRLIQRKSEEINPFWIFQSRESDADFISEAAKYPHKDDLRQVLYAQHFSRSEPGRLVLVTSDKNMRTECRQAKIDTINSDELRQIFHDYGWKCDLSPRITTLLLQRSSVFAQPSATKGTILVQPKESSPPFKKKTKVQKKRGTSKESSGDGQVNKSDDLSKHSAPKALQFKQLPGAVRHQMRRTFSNPHCLPRHLCELLASVDSSRIEFVLGHFRDRCDRKANKSRMTPQVVKKLCLALKHASSAGKTNEMTQARESCATDQPLPVGSPAYLQDDERAVTVMEQNTLTETTFPAGLTAGLTGSPAPLAIETSSGGPAAIEPFPAIGFFAVKTFEPEPSAAASQQSLSRELFAEANIEPAVFAVAQALPVAAEVFADVNAGIAP